MHFENLHDWDLTPTQAVALQRELAGRVRLEPGFTEPPKLVAGTDVSYQRHGKRFFAAVSLLAFPSLELVGCAFAEGVAPFPYISGLLSFREMPVLLEAFRTLEATPDLVLVDGQGIAHPRRLGLATHLGLWLGVPTIGCAKTRLCGEHAEPGSQRGDWAPLTHHNEVIGSVLRTRTNVAPMYISPGHLLGVDQARELALACAGRYRLPEPTRQAHLAANRRRCDLLPRGE